MKIVSYNLNGIRARLPRLIEYLDEQKPDALCLQEIKCDDDAFPIEDIRAAGYDGVWHGQKGFNGVAILTPGRPARAAPHRPARRSRRHPQPLYRGRGGGRRRSPPSICPTAIRSAPRSSPTSSPGSIACAPMREELLAEEKPVVLAGDWNVIPTDDPDDVFSAKAMASDALMQPESRQGLRRILNLGYTDAIRARYPTGQVYTFWDYTAGCWQRDAGFRIDHLLLSAQAADRLRDAGVDKDYRGREKASDHAPDLGRDRELASGRDGGARWDLRSPQCVRSAWWPDPCYGSKIHRVTRADSCIASREPMVKAARRAPAPVWPA